MSATVSPGLTAREVVIAVTVARLLFPPDGPMGIVDGPAHVGEYLNEYAGRLPRAERLQLRGLLQLVDRGYSAASRSSLPFIDAPEEAQQAYLQGWGAASTYTQRMLFEGLRTVLMFAWASQPSVRRAIGMESL